MRYWAFVNGEVPGAFEAAELAALPGFSMTTLVCPAEGEIAEKNWRRAGEFEEVARAIVARQAQVPPAAPPPSEAAIAAAAASADVDALIDDSSMKLFGHVAELMKELEGRREERDLTASLLRQVATLKSELAKARARVVELEDDLPRLAALEEAQRKAHSDLQSLQEKLHAREQALNEARLAAEKARMDQETVKRRLQETANDLAMRNRLVDKLSKELSEKEISLAKSLAVIRRLEEEFARLLPGRTPPPAEAPRETKPAREPRAARAVEAPAAPQPAPAPAPEGRAPAPEGRAPAPEPEVRPLAPKPASPSEPPPLTSLTVPPAPEPPKTPPTYTLDEPPPAPPYIETPPPTDQPKAHEALLGFLKKIFPGQPH